ncbi:MAG: 3-phosphoshikimate 1-carboxyvinyltransferase [Planctomycetes bacterium]|nr:3-phosphoshikimate 1-carboxyvinyltransferase [Planctomycetota bacterium]
MRSGPLHIPKLTATVTRVWPIPGSKSITNRAFILAALSEGDSVLDNVLASDDTRHMRIGLQALGIASHDTGPGQVTVRGGRSRLRAPSAPLFIGNSGTSVRFLTALAALVPGRTTLQGDEHMAKRPISDLIDGLRQLGVEIDCATGCPPLTITGGDLRAGDLVMRGDRSSQYFSALLMAAACAPGETRVRIDGELVSRPYVEMTARMVGDFGGSISSDSDGFVVRPCAYRARPYRIEPDASSASYPFALAAAGGHRLEVAGLNRQTLQGDVAFVDVLRAMGARVEQTALGTAVAGSGSLDGIDVDMFHISDTVMSLAAIAPLCAAPVTIRNIGNIRIKECDRLAAMVSELGRMGARVEAGEDWLRVHPGPLRPATIDCRSDHRIAMSFGVLGACSGVVTIDDPACTAKTYPGFWDDLSACYPSPW